jgi:multidrug resistance efflux pump
MFADLRGRIGRASRRPFGMIAVGAALVAAVAIALASAPLLRGWQGDDTPSTSVRRGALTVRLLESGVLRPARSITYRSPLAGREAEIVFLAPEGTRVGEGDLVVALDATEVTRDLERAVQAERAAQSEFQAAQAEREDAAAQLSSVTEGERALEVEEARAKLTVSEKQVERLRAEHDGLKPLLEKGFITKEELDRAATALEQAESETALTRKRVQWLSEHSHPREQQRARLLVSQRDARVEQARMRVTEVSAAMHTLRAAVAACRVYAERPGLVVYEESLVANPRRKVRVGDRVTITQGIVTIPEVQQMVVESSVREADVHRVKTGQPVVVRVDGFPDLRLSGRVATLGALARTPPDRPGDGKRFDLVASLDASTANLLPEMTARLEIVVGRRKDVLLLPVNAVFERNGTPVVFVRRFWSPETRPVQIGASNEFDVEIQSGVTQGDTVLLVDPQRATPVAPRREGPAPSPAPGAP